MIIPSWWVFGGRAWVFFTPHYRIDYEIIFLPEGADSGFPEGRCGRSSNLHCRGISAPCSQLPPLPAVQAESLKQVKIHPPFPFVFRGSPLPSPSTPLPPAAAALSAAREKVKLHSQPSWVGLDTSGKGMVATDWQETSFPHPAQSRHREWESWSIPAALVPVLTEPSPHPAGWNSSGVSPS